MANVHNFKNDPNLVQIVSLADVEIDRKWNSRNSVENASETADGSKGFDGLVVSMATEGQKTPVMLRPNPKYGKVDGAKPLFLVSGFQRVEAKIETAAGTKDALLLDAKAGGGLAQAKVDALHTEEPTIRAFIVPMTDWEARKENLSENMQRHTLSPADIAFGVADLRKLNPDMSDQSVANVLSKNQSYVSQLKRIYEGTKGKIPAGALYETSKPILILEAWRTAKKKVSVTEMEEISKAPVETQAALYLLKAGYKVAGLTPEGETGGGGAGKWAENAKADAIALGGVLGDLAREGAVTLDGNFFRFENIIRLMNLVHKAPKKTPTEEQMNDLSAVCEDAYNTARKTVPVVVAPVAPAGAVDPKAVATATAAANAAAANGKPGDKPKKGTKGAGATA
jgi:hypothetical protein